MKKECAMNTVCKVNENDVKIVRCLFQNKKGLRIQTILKLTNLKQRVVYKRLELLKTKGVVENIFPIWKIVNGQVDYCATLLKDSNIFELHNISYVLKLMKVPEWWSQRKRRLIKLKNWQFSNVAFGKGATNPYQQLINDNFVIQCYPESLIIIARKRYYAANPHEVIINAMNDVLDILGWFEERMRFKFFPDGVPSLELRNNDFNRMKDHLANTCKKEGKRFLVETKVGKCWVDYSEPFGKEADTPDIQDTLERVTRDHIINKPMLNSELQFAIQQVTSNQVMFNQNFESHVKSIQSLGNSAEANAKSVELLSDVILQLRDEVVNLKKEVSSLKTNNGI